jgi:asparagine synthase (glutamine-hydrolysing)
VPLGSWLRRDLRPLAHDVLLDGTARSRGLFRPAAVEQLLTEHETGIDHGQRLWCLLVLELWLRTEDRAAKPTAAVVAPS